jgi:hypothetical protein
VRYIARNTIWSPAHHSECILSAMESLQSPNAGRCNFTAVKHEGQRRGVLGGRDPAVLAGRGE